MSKETQYWAFDFRFSDSRDIGHHCKECKQPFLKIDQKIAIRRGGRLELRYHEDCFSGQPDPRSQKYSSFQIGKFAGTQQVTAPYYKYNKMRTSNHF